MTSSWMAEKDEPLPRGLVPAAAAAAESSNTAASLFESDRLVTTMWNSPDEASASTLDAAKPTPELAPGFK